MFNKIKFTKKEAKINGHQNKGTKSFKEVEKG